MNPDYNLRELNADRVKAIEKYAVGSVLDVGCGNGKYVNYYSKQMDIKGCDYIEFSSWSGDRTRFHICDLREGLKDFKDDQFDTLFCFEVLEHIQDFELLLKELRRVAKKRILLTVPNCELSQGMKSSGLIYNHWIDKTHVNFFTKDSLSELLLKCGCSKFQISFINPIDPIPFILESFGFSSSFLKKFLSRILRFFLIRKHKMTLLAIIEVEP